MKYALIENNTVVNVICLHPMNADDFPNAVCADEYSVAVGDTCVDGLFYRNGELIKTNLDILMEEKADMVAALAELGVTADE